MSDTIEGKVRDLRNTTLRQYNEQSIVERVCRINSVENPNNNFQNIQRVNTLSRMMFEGENTVIPTNIVNGIVNDEIDFLLSRMNESQEIASGENLFQTIRNTADELRDDYFPNTIIIPRNFTTRIRDWNLEIEPNGDENMNRLNVGLEEPLNVVRLPVNYPFSNIIITSENSTFYEFIPDRDGNRLHVELDFARGFEFPFLLRTRVRITHIENDATKIIVPPI